MAETQNQGYTSQFKRENIVELSRTINEAVNTYAQEKVEGGKVDIFLILAALGQSAYEVTARTIPTSKEEAEKSVEQMKVITDKVVALFDTTRKELNTKAAAEIMAAAHSLALLGEFYSRRRDDVLSQMMLEATKRSLGVEDKKEE